MGRNVVLFFLPISTNEFSFYKWVLRCSRTKLTSFTYKIQDLRLHCFLHCTKWERREQLCGPCPELSQHIHIHSLTAPGPHPHTPPQSNGKQSSPAALRNSGPTTSPASKCFTLPGFQKQGITGPVCLVWSAFANKQGLESLFRTKDNRPPDLCWRLF